ncbi:MAG: (2Fe-2S)-binding protein [Panacagrimonas sp.]
MFICVCKAVSDKRIRRAVEDGAAYSVRDLTRTLGLGTCCGKCVPAARDLLAETLAARPIRLADLGERLGVTA